MPFEKYERCEIDGTDLVLEVRDGYLRLYEGWSEEYIIVQKCEVYPLYRALFDLMRANEFGLVVTYDNENRD